MSAKKTVYARIDEKIALELAAAVFVRRESQTRFVERAISREITRLTLEDAQFAEGLKLAVRLHATGDLPNG